MVIRKRALLWDYTDTQGVPQNLAKVPFDDSHPFVSLINWSGWSPSELQGRAPFRPMISNPSKFSGPEWTAIQNTKEPIILFYNEPDLAGISPQAAADAWHQHVVPLRKQHGKKICSPGCVGDDKGVAWLEQWMKLVADEAPDYITTHYYGTDGNACIKFLQDLHNKFPTKPMIITEIASIHRKYDDVLGFTAQLTNWMDEQSWIHEYGWFGCMRKPADNFVSPAAQLMNPDGSFTDLMFKLMYDQPIKLNGNAVHEAVHEAPPAAAASAVKVMPTTNDDHHNEVQHNAAPSSPPNNDAKAALDMHNSKRHQHGCPPLAWDAGLTAKAEEWAKHLAGIEKMEHSQGSQRPGQGENLYSGWQSSGPVRDPLKSGSQAWINEEKDYHGEKIGEGAFEKFGHYTQATWKSTTHIGMALATGKNGWTYVVGRYSPAGNMTGQKPY